MLKNLKRLLRTVIQSVWISFRWFVNNPKLIESIGLLFLLGGWLLNTFYISKIEQAELKLNREVQIITQTYHLMQITSNIRGEAALTRLTILSPKTVEIDDNNYAYTNAWSFPERRKQWLELNYNSVSKLSDIVSEIDSVRSELPRFNSINLLEAKKRIAVVNKLFYFILDGQDYESANVPVPKLNKVPFDSSVSIGKTVIALSTPVFGALIDVQSDIDKEKRHLMVLYYYVFSLGTALLVAAKYLEWRQELRIVKNT